MTKEQFDAIKLAVKPFGGGEELIQALADLYESSQWRPIREAPRDGTGIIANHKGMLGITFWSKKINWWVAISKNYPPTQFYPLPQPPKEAKGE